MTLDMDFLKDMVLEVYKHVKDLIGTKEGQKKLNRGAGGDISMHIDVVAEKVVIEYLERHNVNALLISEEIGEVYVGEEAKAKEEQLKIIVDPIDGSNNSSRGIPFCSISIAVAKGNQLEDIDKALVFDLTTQEIYWAEKGKGAYVNDRPISVSERDWSDNLMFEIDFDLDSLKMALDKYISLLEKIYRVRTMGSNALSFCLIAKGALDGFIDFRKTNRLMDIAAGYLLIKEAGGHMFSRKGSDLDIHLGLDAQFPLVASNAKLEPFLKKELAKIENN